MGRLVVEVEERESWTALLCKVETKMDVDQFIDYNSVSNGFCSINR